MDPDDKVKIRSQKEEKWDYQEEREKQNLETRQRILNQFTDPLILRFLIVAFLISLLIILFGSAHDIATGKSSGSVWIQAATYLFAFLSGFLFASNSKQ